MLELAARATRVICQGKGGINALLESAMPIPVATSARESGIAVEHGEEKQANGIPATTVDGARFEVRLPP